MDTGTITLIIGIISCVIGVSSFVTGRMARAERNGALEAKVTQALDGIVAINSKLEAFSENQESVKLLISTHDEKIRTLFNQTRELKEALEKSDNTRQVLIDLMQEIKALHRE